MGKCATCGKPAEFMMNLCLLAIAVGLWANVVGSNTLWSTKAVLAQAGPQKYSATPTSPKCNAAGDEGAFASGTIEKGPLAKVPKAWGQFRTAVTVSGRVAFVYEDANGLVRLFNPINCHIEVYAERVP